MSTEPPDIEVAIPAKPEYVALARHALAMLALSLARTRARPARTPRGTTPAPAVAQAQL